MTGLPLFPGEEMLKVSVVQSPMAPPEEEEVQGFFLAFATEQTPFIHLPLRSSAAVAGDGAVESVVPWTGPLRVSD